MPDPASFITCVLLACSSVASREALENPHVQVKQQATALLKSLPHALHHSRPSNPDAQAPSPAPGLPLKDNSPSFQGKQAHFYTSPRKSLSPSELQQAPRMFTNSRLRDPAGTAPPATPSPGNPGGARKRISPHITEGRCARLELPRRARSSLKAREVSLASVALRRQRRGGTSEGRAVSPALSL